MQNNFSTSAGKSLSRQVSLRTVFRTVRQHKSISRAELSRKTGLSKQTTSEVVSVLLDDGWLREAGQTSGNIGRAATNYELNGARAHVFGCDLGGTKIALALADLAGDIVIEKIVPTTKVGGTTVIDQIGALVGELAHEAGIAKTSILSGAIGVPGAYDRRTDRLRLVSNITGLEDFPISELFAETLGFGVHIENDVTIAAKGELWAGAGERCDSFAFLAMGTGVGLGLVSEGQIVRGFRGGAGEIASLPVGGNPFDSRNFGSGTLESLVSSNAIVARYKGWGGAGADTVAAIFDKLAVGDALAESLIDEVARELAVAIVAIIAIADPAMIVTGGSIGARPELIERIAAILPRCTPNPVPLQVSALGSRAALIGAVSTALDELHEQVL